MPLDPIAYRPYADPDDFIREVTDLIWVSRDIDYIVRTTSRTRSCMAASARPWTATGSSTEA